MIQNISPEGIQIDDYFYYWRELCPTNYCYYINETIKVGDKFKPKFLFGD